MKSSRLQLVARGLVAAVAALCLAGACGCASAQPGTQMTLGPVSYDKAFSTARMVMAQYFRVDEADADTGRIRTLPIFIDSARFGVSDSPPDRQLADLTLRRDGQYVVATLAVAVQRQGSEAYRTFQGRQENYSGMPNQTPADLEAATTPRQNDTWETYRYDRLLENTILRDLDRLLRPIEETPSRP